MTHAAGATAVTVAASPCRTDNTHSRPADAGGAMRAVQDNPGAAQADVAAFGMAHSPL